MAYLQKQKRRLYHELSSIIYHSNNFKKEEGDWIKHYTTSIGDGESCNVAKENSKIIYEVNAFLFYVKDCLDVLNQLIRRGYRLHYGQTYKNGGEALIRNLKDNNYPKDLQAKRDKMIAVIESNKRWILHTVEMRDKVTHDSDLIGFECFYQHARTENDCICVCLPSMPNDKRVKTYLDNTWEKLVSLIRDIIKVISS